MRRKTAARRGLIWLASPVSSSIKYFRLWVGSYHTKLPLTHLDDDENCHIHGRLVISIDGKVLPQLGYWGDDDVCFNDWVEQLEEIETWSKRKSTDPYTFDEGEQGQPAFRFVRQGESVLVSVADSLISDGKANEDFQNVECDVDAMRSSIRSFLNGLAAELRSTVGRERAEAWWPTTGMPNQQ